MSGSVERLSSLSLFPTSFHLLLTCPTYKISRNCTMSCCTLLLVIFVFYGPHNGNVYIARAGTGDGCLVIIHGG